MKSSEDELAEAAQWCKDHRWRVRLESALNFIKPLVNILALPFIAIFIGFLAFFIVVLEVSLRVREQFKDQWFWEMFL